MKNREMDRLAGGWLAAMLRLVVCVSVLFFVYPVYGHGEVHDIIVELDKKVAEHPDDAGLYMERADYLYKAHHYAEALRDLEMLANLAPENQLRYLLKAEIYLEQKQADLAADALAVYIKCHPVDARGYLVRRRLFLLKGQAQAAEDDLQKAIKLQAKPSLHLYLTLIHDMLDRGALDAALEVYDAAEVDLGPVSSLLSSKARVLRDHGRPELAAAGYARLREIQPKLSFPWWLEEAEMWSKVDVVRSKNAYEMAEKSWVLLPRRTRGLAVFQEQYKEVQGVLREGAESRKK